MVIDIILGIILSLIGLFFFFYIKYDRSLSTWILSLSKFIYFSGHPLLDDDEKFKLVKQKFGSVFVSLVVILGKTLLIILFLLFIVVVFSITRFLISGHAFAEIKQETLFSVLFPPYLLRWPFIVGTLLPVFVFPYFLKGKKETTYSPIDKLLHYVFMGNENFAKFLFSLESWINRKQIIKNQSTNNVYIAGLARAGTTVLMQYLGQVQQFKSLSYRNLPFLFLPKTGIKLSSKKKTRQKERTHHDGIMHSLDSYEALEEPFWRVYSGKDYIMENKLVSYQIPPKKYLKYQVFRKLVAGNKTYLAKNNNHLLRAESLHKLDKEAGITTITVIPFREPFAQAASLMNQHHHLSALQTEDGFTRDYMDLLVHHEFGLSLKVQVFDDLSMENIKSFDPENISFWLEVWHIFYEKVLSLYQEVEGVYFFSYDQFVENPQKSLQKLFTVLEIATDQPSLIEIKEFRKKEYSRENMIDQKFDILYKRLLSISINKPHE